MSALLRARPFTFNDEFLLLHTSLYIIILFIFYTLTTKTGVSVFYLGVPNNSYIYLYILIYTPLTETSVYVVLSCL